MNTVVVGISTDKLTAQQQFTKKENLNFPLFADAGKQVAQTFGVLGKNGFAQRSTFVIDKNGVVRKIFRPVTNPAQHPAEVLAYIKKNLADRK